MLRVVHLFNLKRNVGEREFIEWLDAKLDAATRQFGCLERKTWVHLDGFEGSYARPKRLKNRPKYVNEAYWESEADANKFREWLTTSPEGRELHDHWFGSIQDHTVIRYAEGWAPIPMEG